MIEYLARSYLKQLCLALVHLGTLLKPAMNEMLSCIQLAAKVRLGSNGLIPTGRYIHTVAAGQSLALHYRARFGSVKVFESNTQHPIN